MKERGKTVIGRGKKFFFSILVVGVSLLVTEVLLQGLYRVSAGEWLWKWWAVPIYEADASRVFRVKSNLNFVHKTIEYEARYYTNAQGFRTDDSQQLTRVEKSPTVYRIMYLGPSFAFGWGVDHEESYAYLISEELEVSDKRIESINVGTPSQPMLYQLAWLEKKGYRYAPDLIVQTVYSDCYANLATDGILPDNVPYVESGYLFPPRPESPGGAARELFRRNRRYSALAYFGWRLYVALAADPGTGGTGEELYQPPDGRDAFSLEETLERYRACERFIWGALKKEIPIVFIYVPLAYVVRPADVIRVKHQGNVKDPIAERVRSKRVEQMLVDNGIHFVDLTHALVEADRDARMYNLYDIHFTPEGNRVAANAALPTVQKAVDQRTLLPNDP